MCSVPVVTIETMSPEAVQKIRADLGVTQTNMTILADMLTELQPGKEHPEDRSLLEQLHGTCRAMQTRLVELIAQVDDDGLTADLLEMNDNMNNLFLRYERFEKNQVQVKHSQQGAIRKAPPAALGGAGAGPGAAGAAPTKSLMDAPLIDFSAGAEQPPSFTQVPSMAHFPDEDADNLAEWIGAKNVDTDGATSSEFDQFLAERAAAGDTPRRQDK